GVDMLEIPRRFDDLLIALAGARLCLEQQQRADIHVAIAKYFAFLDDWIGRDPDTVLQATKISMVKITAQLHAARILLDRHIKQDDSPAAIPRAGPAGFWIATA